MIKSQDGMGVGILGFEMITRLAEGFLSRRA